MARCDDGCPVPRVSDEELEFYGEQYVRHGLAEVVSFESFLLDPDRYLPREGRTAAASPRRSAGPWRSLLVLLGIRPLARSPHA